jgi:hypothetical protein
MHTSSSEDCACQLGELLEQPLPCDHLHLAVHSAIGPAVNNDGNCWLQLQEQHWCYSTRSAVVLEQALNLAEQSGRGRLTGGREWPASSKLSKSEQCAQWHNWASAANHLELIHKSQLALDQLHQSCTDHQCLLLPSPVYAEQQQSVLVAAALRVQCMWRGTAARQHYRRQQLWTSAAVTLQCCWRGVLARHVSACLHQEQQRHRFETDASLQHGAATTIQAAIRGHTVRQRLKRALAAASQGQHLLSSNHSNHNPVAKHGAGESSSTALPSAGKSAVVAAAAAADDDADCADYLGVLDNFVWFTPELLELMNPPATAVAESTGPLPPHLPLPVFAAGAGTESLTGSNSPFHSLQNGAAASPVNIASSLTDSAAPDSGLAASVPVGVAAAAGGVRLTDMTGFEGVDPAAANYGATRYESKLQSLMQEWGFTDRATAEAYYRSVASLHMHIQLPAHPSS